MFINDRLLTLVAMMTLLETISWDDCPRMNVPSLDDDHEKIIQTINMIVELIHTNEKEVELCSATKRLILHTSSHQQKEECFLELHDYPLLSQHKEEHANLLNALLKIKDNINKGVPSKSVKAKLEDQLVNGLFFQHIFVSDLQIAKYINDKQHIDDDVLRTSATRDDVKIQLKKQLKALYDFKDIEITSANNKVTAVEFNEEISIASNIKMQACENIKLILDDIAADRPIELKRIADSSASILKSFERNKNALLALSLIKDKDSSVVVHSVNVAIYLIAFSKVMGFGEHTIINIGIGGLLHDIGLVGLASKNKIDRKQALPKELKRQENHIQKCLEILGNINNIPQEVSIIAGQHHERKDGTGYPNSLCSNEIHILGKMASIVDEFDRITSNRPNKTPLSPDKAIIQLLKQSKNCFDSELIHIFIKTIGIHPIGTVVELNNGCITVVTENDSESMLQPVVNVVYNEKGIRTEKIRIVDLKKAQKDSPTQIKRVTKIKQRDFDPMDAILGLKVKPKTLK
jgi:hemerythrin-like metal-binding protein